MRVLYFSRAYSPHDHRFLEVMARSAHEIHFLQLESSGGSDDRPVPAAVRRVQWLKGARPFRWQDAPARRGELRRILADLKPDVVHAGPIQNCAFLTALAGFHPLVAMSWGSDLLRDAHRSRVWEWATRYTLTHTDVLLGDCRAVADEAAAYGFSAGRTVLFPWGVDLEQFSPGPDGGLRERLGWQDQFVLLCLRSWEEVYGVDHLLRAFARAAAQNPALRLLLLGNGSQAGLVHQIIADHQLQDRVHLGGRIKQADLPRYYRAADLYVSASHSDGSSVSLLEALACGLPALVSDIPGNREWVQEGVQGWLFPDGDETRLAESIQHIAGESEALSAMGKAGRKTAEEGANWKENSQRLWQAYDMALDNGGAVE